MRRLVVCFYRTRGVLRKVRASSVKNSVVTVALRCSRRVEWSMVSVVEANGVEAEIKGENNEGFVAFRFDCRFGIIRSIE